MRLVLTLLLACLATAALAQEVMKERWQREGWRTDFSRMMVEPIEIRAGGPPRDGIPPIDEPRFVPVTGHDELSPKESVIAFAHDGDARAYPLRILMWHEIVNDVVGGKPVVVTYCPLCNAAIVFDARVNGTAHTFGTTGKLRKSDLIMYDRATDSWWQQFSGEAIAGAMTGKRLTFLPARLMSWQAFASAHPDGKVLVPDDPGRRDYGRNPYVGYDRSDRPFLYDGSMPDGIEPMARVVVVRTDSDAMPLVVALDHLASKGELTLDDVRLRWQPGRVSALDDARVDGGRDVGSIETTRDGRPVPHDLTFAFVAHAFHPQARIVQGR